MSSLERRLDRLEEYTRPEPEDESKREEDRKRIREQAEHANYCGWGKEVGKWPLFEINEDGNVFCTHDGRPVTDSRQTLAEFFYWMAVGYGEPALIHDEEDQAFYTPSGELALSRDLVNLQNLGQARREYDRLRGGGRT